MLSKIKYIDIFYKLVLVLLMSANLNKGMWLLGQFLFSVFPQLLNNERGNVFSVFILVMLTQASGLRLVCVVVRRCLHVAVVFSFRCWFTVAVILILQVLLVEVVKALSVNRHAFIHVFAFLLHDNHFQVFGLVCRQSVSCGC